MKEDDIVYVLKLTEEEKHTLYEQGVSIEEIKKKARYKISRKDYLNMVKKRNEKGDQSVCECRHSINHHDPSDDIYKCPAGKCNFCRKCKMYKEKT